MSFNIQKTESVKEFGGFLERYTHDSVVCQCTMTFSVYLPPQITAESVPALYWLSGLTCNDDNFRTKAGAQRYAAEAGVALIIPDTSPRGDDVPNDDGYDLGQAAGFYVNATQAPWDKHFNMYDYIVEELPQVIAAMNLNLNGRVSISGHSMGGHGALMIALRNPDRYDSASAFSPICNPSVSPWGIKAFTNYLGEDQSDWTAYDSHSLIASLEQPLPLFVDQGLDDEFYPKELLTEAFKAQCDQHGVDAVIRLQEGYDHSYHFIGTFFGEHMAFHKKHLSK